MHVLDKPFVRNSINTNGHEVARKSLQEFIPSSVRSSVYTTHPIHSMPSHHMTSHPVYKSRTKKVHIFVVVCSGVTFSRLWLNILLDWFHFSLEHRLEFQFRCNEKQIYIRVASELFNVRSVTTRSERTILRTSKQVSVG